MAFTDDLRGLSRAEQIARIQAVAREHDDELDERAAAEALDLYTTLADGGPETFAGKLEAALAALARSNPRLADRIGAQYMSLLPKRSYPDRVLPPEAVLMTQTPQEKARAQLHAQVTAAAEASAAVGKHPAHWHLHHIARATQSPSLRTEIARRLADTGQPSAPGRPAGTGETITRRHAARVIARLGQIHMQAAADPEPEAGA